MTIRAATSADCPGIAEIENVAIQNHFAHFGTTPVTPKEVEQALAAAGERFPWLIAEEGGKVIGFARAGAWKAREAYRWTCEVGVYIAEDHQRKGIGRTLYDELFPELERRGFRTILAGITQPNEASVRLHEAMGMRLIGTFPMNGFKFGEWRDVGYWAIHVGDGPPTIN